ncbi:hypothetical protein pv_105 [Pithovirus sibericum]|uniref:Uncharacterized protein n=1 Tax=Pithovirus sibericum TaxID=1450746 RepID=W5S5W5_9VIRU|nr:hypothetical protein pv_105 [Pithovirus sibericum]AHH01672.1 hypothetical protein pv_105 [Pithovirus sibericum]WIL05239.1 hypothetical protein pmam_200 [Pithovirus mammoth]
MSSQNKLLYFTSSLSEKDLKREICRAYSELNRLIAKGEPRLICKFNVNRVHRQDEYLGFGFLHVHDRRIFFALIGKNFDGSDRVQYSEPEISPEDKHEGWADYPEEEEVPLEPLISFDEIRFSPAELPPLDRKFCPDVLCCRSFPKEILTSELLTLVKPYCSSKQVKYPKVTLVAPEKKRRTEIEAISGNQIAFIGFDPATDDARIALMMIRKSQIRNFQLSFQHSYRSIKNSSKGKE